MQAPASVPQGVVIRPTKLFIGGISRRTTTKQLRDHFSKRGRVLDCVAMRQPDGRPRGFAYVTLDSPAAAEYFLREPQMIDDRIVDLKPAVPDTSSVSAGGRGGGAGAAGHHHHHRDSVPRMPAAHLSQQSPYCMWGDHLGLYAGTGVVGGGTATLPGSLTLPALDGAQHCWLDNQALDFSSSSPHSLLCDRLLPSMGMALPPSLSQPAVVSAVHDEKAMSRPATLAKAVLGEVTNLLDDGGACLDAGNKLKPWDNSKVHASVNMGGMGGAHPKVASLTMQLLPSARDMIDDDDFFVKEDPEEESPTAERTQPTSSTNSGTSSPQMAPASPCDIASLPSIGSAHHSSGECRRCNFFARGCCRNGSDCLFCHFPHDRRQLSRQAKREAKAAQLLAQQQIQGWQDGQMSDVSDVDMFTLDVTKTHAEGVGLASPIPPKFPATAGFPGLLPPPGLPPPPHFAALNGRPSTMASHNGIVMPCQVTSTFGPLLATSPPPTPAGSKTPMTTREVCNVGTQTESEVICPRCGAPAAF